MQLIFLPCLALLTVDGIIELQSLMFFFQRRLYEFALNAVCSPLRVIESETTSEELADHVAKV